MLMIQPIHPSTVFLQPAHSSIYNLISGHFRMALGCHAVVLIPMECTRTILLAQVSPGTVGADEIQRVASTPQSSCPCYDYTLGVEPPGLSLGSGTCEASTMHC